MFNTTKKRANKGCVFETEKEMLENYFQLIKQGPEEDRYKRVLKAIQSPMNPSTYR